MSHSIPREPLIAVVGATGTGKSQLAVTLAERFNGEIINGDALQMYEGLPIATNKIPLEERKGIPHHLLGCIRLDEQPWTVGTFVAKASAVIEEIRSRGRLPILVGGTHFYTQSLLFKDTILAKKEESLTPEEQEIKWPILGASAEEMMAELRKVDPQMAARWHPRDRRKIRRSLEIWLQTGKRPSEIYEEQRKQKPPTLPTTPSPTTNPDQAAQDPTLETPTNVHPPLRYSTLIFWVHTDREILKERLNQRVDSMLENGLLSEISSMHASYLRQTTQGRCNSIDTTRGIWVAVGYKEFGPYLKALEEQLPQLPQQQPQSPAAGTPAAQTQLPQPPTLTPLLHASISATKAATRQYSMRQTRWLRLKLLPAFLSSSSSSSSSHLFLLDSTSLSPPSWSTNVSTPTCALTADFLAGREMPDAVAVCEKAGRVFGLGEGKRMRKSGVDGGDGGGGHGNEESESGEGGRGGGCYARVCDVCGTTLMTERDLEQHLRSKKHRGLVRRERERERVGGRRGDEYWRGEGRGKVEGSAGNTGQGPGGGR